MIAKVFVTLKREVLDPQGEAVRNGLVALGIAGVREVRVGKVIEIDLEDRADRDALAAEVERAAGLLLANPVIEDHQVHLEPSS